MADVLTVLSKKSQGKQTLAIQTSVQYCYESDLSSTPHNSTFNITYRYNIFH